jgi:hypothetical protein
MSWAAPRGLTEEHGRWHCKSQGRQWKLEAKGFMVARRLDIGGIFLRSGFSPDHASRLRRFRSARPHGHATFILSQQTIDVRSWIAAQPRSRRAR